MDHQAFAQLLGNYGEFIGAIAVVVTLIFVGMQVRHSWEATRESSLIQQEAAADQVFEHMARWRSHIVNNQEVSSLFLKGGIRERLSDEESFRYEMLCWDWIFSSWRGYDRIMAIGGDRDLADEIIRVSAEYASVYPGLGDILKTLEGNPAFEHYYRRVDAALSGDSEA
jgi:hypothetical protein